MTNLKNYGKDTFTSMIKDWLADQGGEMEDLQINEIEFENGKWVAYASDVKTCYTLTDDGTGNIAINYTASK